MFHYDEQPIARRVAACAGSILGAFATYVIFPLAMQAKERAPESVAGATEAAFSHPVVIALASTLFLPILVWMIWRAMSDPSSLMRVVLGIAAFNAVVLAGAYVAMNAFSEVPVDPQQTFHELYMPLVVFGALPIGLYLVREGFWQSTRSEGRRSRR